MPSVYGCVAGAVITPIGVCTPVLQLSWTCSGLVFCFAYIHKLYILLSAHGMCLLSSLRLFDG